jgi:hypothetical protein
MNTIKPLTTRSRHLLAGVRDELRDRRQARANRRALERELASYSSRSDVDDLLAMIGDQTDPDAELIREILNRNQARQHPWGLLAS